MIPCIVEYPSPTGGYTINCLSRPVTYSVYFLQSSTTNRTYVGVSINPFHRLRQHNGEIEADKGAKRTKIGRPWYIVCIVTGFPTCTAAYQFEYKWHKIRAATVRISDSSGGSSGGKRRYKKCEHIIGCNAGLEFMFNCKWTSRSPEPKSFPLTVIWNHTNASTNYLWSPQRLDYQCWSVYQGCINMNLLMQMYKF